MPSRMRALSGAGSAGPRSGPQRRRRTWRRSLAADAALAAALALIGVFGSSQADLSGGQDRPVDGYGYALVLIAALVLVVRRRWPVPVLVVSTAATTTYLVAQYAYGPIMFAFAAAVYTVARHRPPAWSVPAGAVAMAMPLAHLLRDGLGGYLEPIFGSAWVVVPFAVGISVRMWRETTDRTRAAAIRERVDDERLRIAQEVHDIVGHGLAAIRMQAEVALHVLPKRPGHAEEALTTISRTSGEALEELRATLAVVRSPGASGDDPATRTPAPAPGLDRLPELRERMARAGLQVALVTEGTPRALPLGVDLASYRVVQESLTNALRHSGADRATVTVAYRPDAVALVVNNPLPRPLADGSGGSGIAGMRERVRTLGGELMAGPAADGREYEVRARIPVGGDG